MEKVYCKNCAYLVWRNDVVTFYKCAHPDNCKIQDTFYEKQYEVPYCEDVNYKNDCKYFKQKISTWTKLQKVYSNLKERVGVILSTLVGKKK